jgi:Spy/CpxP family protein refolding chaperone
MKSALTALLLSVVLAGTLPADPPAGEDVFGRYLFPPDKVMAHAGELGLDEAQRKAIRGEVQKAQTKFLDLQFDLQAESEKMVNLLQEKPVDEGRVLAEVDRVLAIEREIKKTQISLLIRIKNQLTSAQQAKLSEPQKAGNP